MTARLLTPSPPVVSLVTGHFQEGPGYASWRPHGTGDYLLMLTLSGSGRIGYDGGVIETATGQIVFLRPHTPHDYGTARGATGWELVWTHFVPRPYWLPWLAWPEVSPGLYLLTLPPGNTQVADALHEMHRRATGGLPRRDDWAMNALETALLHCDTVNPSRADARTDSRVVAAMGYLLDNLARPVALPDLAAHVGLSPSRLSHLFHDQTGQTPQQFVERERLQRATQLLRLTGRTVAAIAREVGYENPFYFTLRFKRQTGLSPRDWRKANTP